MIFLKKEYFFTFIFSLILLVSCSGDDNISDTNNGDDGNGGGNVTIPNNNRSTGVSANELLSESFFSKIYVDLVYVEGSQPTASAVSNLRSFLSARLNKSSGIEIVQKSIPATGKTSYTISEIVEIENTQRTRFNSQDEIAVFAFFADGESSENDGNSVVLGTAYKNTSFVIFEETLKVAANNSSTSLATIESTVIRHEFAHLLGLVNNGSTMQTQHQDVDNGKHCDVEDCLMFFQVETMQGMMGLFSGGGSVPELDSQCLADLRANGGK